jgi:hypothetical protein
MLRQSNLSSTLSRHLHPLSQFKQTAISCLGASPAPTAAGARRGVRHIGVRETCTNPDDDLSEPGAFCEQGPRESAPHREPRLCVSSKKNTTNVPAQAASARNRFVEARSILSALAGRDRSTARSSEKYCAPIIC